MVKKHLITGIRGQDGLFLTAHILDKNEDHEIIGISRNIDTNPFFNKLKSINSEVKVQNVQILNLDILDNFAVNKLISDYQPDCIYNLSGPSSVYKSLNDHGETYRTIGTIFSNIIDSVLENNLKCNIFQASSSEMFDEKSGPLDENSSLKPRSPYAEAKLQIHKKIQNLKLHEFLNISSGIMFNHESEFRDEEYLIMKIINSAANIKNGASENLTVGSLDLIRDWSYAGDVAEAIYKINNKENSEDYVIGSGQGNSIRNIVEIVFNYFSIDWKEYVNEDPVFLRSGDPNSIVANPSKIKKELGWNTRISLEEILIKCLKKFHPNNN